jgi:glutaminyl-tRNA synthetase
MPPATGPAAPATARTMPRAARSGRIRTRFPPEPNGYLHIGHAKSICLNFGLARDYGGVCHLRFDDTNPEKEDQEFVDAIVDTVRWLGFDWEAPINGTSHLYHASDYFDFMYRAAEYLIESGHAYVDEQSAEEMRLNRGDFGKPGVNSPFATARPPSTWRAFARCATAGMPTAAWCCGPRSTWPAPTSTCATRRSTASAAPTPQHRQQVVHLPDVCLCAPDRGRAGADHAQHLHAGVRGPAPWYDWLLQRLIEGGLLRQPPPRQYEFARLNLTYVITSKRKLAQLVYDGKVSGWDDPRMPTIVGLRRRGYTPESLRLMAERTGTSKAAAGSTTAPWRAACAKTWKTRPTAAWPCWTRSSWCSPTGTRSGAATPGYLETARSPCRTAPAEGAGKRQFKMGREVWIERERLRGSAAQGLQAPVPRQPGAPEVRPRHRMHRLGAQGRRRPGHQVHAWSCPTPRAAPPAPTRVKVKAAITWVAWPTACGRSAPVRPPVHRTPARRRRQGLPGQPEPGQPESGAPPGRALPGQRPGRTTSSSSSATATSWPTGSTTFPPNWQ